MKKLPATLKVGALVRGMDATVEIRVADDGTKRFALSLSSEYEVDRGWGMKEVLSHDKGSVRLDRANSGAMPLLFNHNWDDPVGMVDKASLKNKRLLVEGTFFTTQRAQDVAAMVAGGLKNVSVGYRINKIEEDCENEVYTITDWEPYEASIAPVPADPTVGNGRAMTRDGQSDERELIVSKHLEPDPDPGESAPTPEPTEALTTRASSFLPPANSGQTNGDDSMTTKVTDDAAAAAERDSAAAAAAAKAKTDTRGEPRVTGTPGPDAIEMEKHRVRAIENMCKATGMDDGLRNQWITSGSSFEKVSDQVLLIQEERSKKNPQKNSAFLDLSANDTRKFSLVKAIRAISNNGDWREAAFEAECSMEISTRLSKIPDPKKFYVPYDIQRRSIDPRALSAQNRALNMSGVAPYAQRADIVGTATQGGYLVETVNLGFIELLRNRSVAYRLGARQLSGLVGNVNVPRQSGAATAYWQTGETNTATESEQAFGQMALSPHTVMAYTEISRLLLLQSSPDVEGIVNADLAAVAALAIDKGALAGTGSAGQPTGIANVTGVGVATSGDMTGIGYAGQLDFQVAVANANVMPAAGAYATTPAVAKLLMSRTRFANTNTPLWDGNLWDANGALGCAGFPGMSSNQIAASTMYFGDWQSLVIAEWGVLEIEVNPYAGFQAGIIGIRAMMTIDVGLRYPAAFCIGSAIT